MRDDISRSTIYGLKPALLRFVLVGAINSLLFLGIFIVLEKLTEDYLFSILIAFVYSVTASFILQSRVVFRAKRIRKTAVVKFLVLNISLFIVNVFWLEILISGFHMPPWLVQSFWVLFSNLLRFISYKHKVFPEGG